MDREELAELQKLIDTYSRIVFFGGAGVSTASGIPDFRSADGLYNNMGSEYAKYHPEYLLSSDCLYHEPALFFKFYSSMLDTREFEPNAAHYKLAELEKAGKMTGVVTQNIDGLHQRAGSEKVYELHSSVERVHCDSCGKRFLGDAIFGHFDDLPDDASGEDLIPRCDVCGGMIRPDVTLYGESLPEDQIMGAINAIRTADMMIIAGTSLVVYPAAGFVDYFEGDKVVLMNIEATHRDSWADLVIRDPMAEVFAEIV